MPIALIFGGSGQVGKYLVDFLLEKGYEVHATYFKHTPTSSTRKVGVHWSKLNITDYRDVSYAINTILPDEIYNLASMMFAPASWEDPIWCNNVNYMAVQSILQLIWKVKSDTKFFNAGSAEVFDLNYPIQSESTPMFPRNPYGVSKLAAQHLVRIYREEKKLFACTGILFNMESPYREDSFFSVRVTKAAAMIAAGLQEHLTLGNLDARRDWGWTEEYVEAMWKMLQVRVPDDYVLGTGESHSCKEFVAKAFEFAGVKPSLNNLSYSTEKDHTRDVLHANPAKANMLLKWKPKTTFENVVRKLVAHHKIMIEKLSRTV